MARWAIKHIPTGKYYCEDEGGAYIVDGDEGIISWAKRDTPDQILEDMQDMVDDNGLIFTEMGEFPLEDFEVAEL